MKWRRRQPPVLDLSALVDGSGGRERPPVPLSDLVGGLSEPPSTSLLLFVFIKPDCDGCEELLRAATGEDALLEGPWTILWCLRGATPEVDALADRLAGPVLLGEAAFTRFSVTSGPFFVVATLDGVVLGEGVPFGATHLREQLDAVLAGRGTPVHRLEPGAEQP